MKKSKSIALIILMFIGIVIGAITLGNAILGNYQAAIFYLLLCYIILKTIFTDIK